MPQPYSNCYESVETSIANEMKKFNLKYSRKHCLTLCEQKLYIEKFKCYNLRFPKIFDDVPPCNRLYKLNFNLSTCYKECPFECVSTKYSSSVSYTDFPSYIYYDSMVTQDFDYYSLVFKTSNITYEMLKESMARISIDFDELKMTQITESASFSLVDLTADIGGTLGLFIGVSVLSFVELVELFVDMLLIMCSNWLNKNHN